MIDQQKTQPHYLITVQYDAESQDLVIEKDIELLEEEEGVPLVTWLFEGIEDLSSDGWSPGIVFNEKYSGPFFTICQNRDGIIGNGNNGIPGEYPYHAALIPPARSTESPILSSQDALVVNSIKLDRPNTSAAIKVSVVKDGDGHLLMVRPETVRRTHNLSVMWEVVGEVPKELGEWYPRVVFDDEPEGADLHFGPFSRWESNNTTVVGTGSGEIGSYKYRFELVSITDDGLSIKSSPDPTIDNEGNPGGVPEGGEVDPCK